MTMNDRRRAEATIDFPPFENAEIGEGTLVEPDVMVGFRYHADCGPARVGKHGILRKGTIIYADVTIKDYFQSGHYAVIRANVEIGDYCTVLNHSTLEGLIRFGDGVRIMSHVYIPSRTWFGSNVFVGPGVTFLNDRQPGRYEVMSTPKGATIEDDVMIGGGCTIMAGIRIGERSFIAAGAVVIRDVPPKSLVVGVPGRVKPLPASLDMPNNRRLTRQPLDLWHPRTPDLRMIAWPEDWSNRRSTTV
jgi:acetyltransferase-like isoleucine patch superfamily enzyme